MTFTHALSTNNYGPAKFIVDASAANGTHTTIASALTSASSGDTIFIRPGTYTEDLTLKAGVNLTAFSGDGGTPNVTIVGKATFTAAGTVTISNIRLQTNSDFFLVVSGSAASIVNIDSCYLNCSNNTGISYTTSSSSAFIDIKKCMGNLGTTGIAYFSSSSAGTLRILYSNLANTGLSTTANTVSAASLVVFYSTIDNPITTSGTGGITAEYLEMNLSGLNATCLTHGGSLAGSRVVLFSRFLSGTASAISVGSTLNINFCVINSSNTNAITGAGTVMYGNIEFSGTSSTINTTTQTPFVSTQGIQLSTLQPTFFATAAAQNDVTGDGTTYTIQFSTEIYDQNNNWDGTSTFTAPYTGRYYFTCNIAQGQLGAAHTTSQIQCVASNRSLSVLACAGGAMRSAANVLVISGSTFMDMDAADTATFTITVTGSTKTVDVIVGSSLGGMLYT